MLMLILTTTLIYSTYTSEYRGKLTFIQMGNIQRMNEDLKSILMNLPEGVILINNSTKEVALGNYEFRRLFQLPKYAQIDKINERIKDNVLSTYNRVGQQ